MEDDSLLQSQDSNVSTTAIGSSSPDPSMDPSNVVANGNSDGNSNENHTNNNNVDMDVDEGDQVDSNAAVDELLNQAEADFEPSIVLLVQMQNRFEQIQDRKDEIRQSTQLLTWESGQLKEKIERNEVV